MLAAELEQHPVLQGERFAERVAEICRELPGVSSLEGIKYRRILIPGLIGGEIQFAQLAFLAHALRMRGAEVTTLLCDEFLPACTLKKVDHHESACTRWCYKNIGPFIRAAKLPHRWYSEFITEREKLECARTAQNVSPERIRKFEFRGVPLGEHIDRSIESYFKVGAFDVDDPPMVAAAREFLTAAMWLTVISERAFDELGIEKVFMEDGEKTDWGIFREVARCRGVAVDVVLGAPRGHSLLIEHDRHPQPSEQMPLWPVWKDVPLTESQNAELDEYFAGRATTPYEDHVWTAISPLRDQDEVRRRIGLPASQSLHRQDACATSSPTPEGMGHPPTLSSTPKGMGHPKGDRLESRSHSAAGLVFAMFPNLSFDAKLTTKCPTYDTAAEWVAETIRFFEGQPQHHLVVKVHPSEGLQQVQDPTVEYLSERFVRFPDNVHVIPPETDLTALDLVRLLDVALVYTSTVGVEATYYGKPVINVGGGWHVGRGWSIDVTTPTQYLETLDRICSEGRPPVAPKELGRRYAYAAFFRSLLPIRYYTSMYPRIMSLNLNSLHDLAPGCDASIDTACRGVLMGDLFCLDEHLPANLTCAGQSGPPA